MLSVVNQRMEMRDAIARNTLNTTIATATNTSRGSLKETGVSVQYVSYIL